MFDLNLSFIRLIQDAQMLGGPCRAGQADHGIGHVEAPARAPRLPAQIAAGLANPERRFPSGERQPEIRDSHTAANRDRATLLPFGPHFQVELAEQGHRQLLARNQRQRVDIHLRRAQVDIPVPCR